jgi:membrane dipeptidase
VSPAHSPAPSGKATYWGLSSLTIPSVLLLTSLPSALESHFNKVLVSPPYRVSSRAQELHRSLWIADLHADSLLWGRNLLKESSRCHVDVPRLIGGNVALPVFSLPTKTPWGLNIDRNRADSDQTWLAIAETWPPKTWNDLRQRALYQGRRLPQMANRSEGKFVLIRNRAELKHYAESRKSNSQLTSWDLVD